MEKRLERKIKFCFEMVEHIKKQDIPLQKKLGLIKNQVDFINHYFEEYLKIKRDKKC